MDYKKQATDFLKKAGATMIIEKSENQSAPLWAKPGDKHGFMYNITISRAGRSYSFNFWDSIKNREDEEHNKKTRAGKFKPSEYDILACLTKHDIGTFSEFCADFGYDEDSKTAEKTFLAVIDEYKNIERLFSDVMEDLQEIN